MVFYYSSEAQRDCLVHFSKPKSTPFITVFIEYVSSNGVPYSEGMKIPIVTC